MRVLWVTPQRPDESGGGGSHHEYELLRMLATRHDIEVITSHPGGANIDGVRAEVVDGWTTRPGPTSKLTRARMELTAREPAFAWRNAASIAPIRRAVSARDADLVHVTFGELAPILPACRAPRALLLFDSYSRHASAALAVEKMPRRRALARLELARCRWFERKWYRRADALACVTPEDAAFVSALVRREVEVIPNPISPDLFVEPDRIRSSDLVLFVGSMGYPPNIDAIRWLWEEIWPAIEAARPSARLLVVGRANDDPSVLAPLRRMLGDRLLLDVPDIRPYYWDAAVTVAPVRLGGGLKNKVIHAMACGSPVVATSHAIEGTRAVADRDVLVADDAAGFAKAVVSVLEDPAQAEQRAAAARELVSGLVTANTTDMVDRWWENAIESAARRESLR